MLLSVGVETPAEVGTRHTFLGISHTRHHVRRERDPSERTDPPEQPKERFCYCDKELDCEQCE
jgi:hypothetical protein